MSLFSRRLNYVGTRKSFSKISTELKIPYRQTLKMRSGDIKSTTTQNSDMSRLYRREAYNASREQGVPTGSARILSSYSPEHLKIKLAEVDLYINDLATYHVTQKAELEPDTPLQDIIDEHFMAIKDNIKKSMRKNRRTIEDMIEHGIS